MLGFLVLKRRLHGINLETVQLPPKIVGVSGSQERPPWNILGNSAASPKNQTPRVVSKAIGVKTPTAAGH